MEKTGNLKSGTSPCVKCGCNSFAIIDGDPLCYDCSKAEGSKQASADTCAGSCKTTEELTNNHKD